jgi:predicted nucleic acid-binding protein
MILDTDIFIFAERGDKKAQEVILGEKDLKISVVSRMELVQGCRDKKELAVLENFLQTVKCRIMHCSNEISITADVLTQGYFTLAASW